MGKHREQARLRREVDLYTLQSAIRYFIAREKRHPKYRELATLTNFTLARVKELMWYLNQLGLGFESYIIPTPNPIEYDTLLSDIDKLLASGLSKGAIADMVAWKLFNQENVVD